MRVHFINIFLTFFLYSFILPTLASDKDTLVIVSIEEKSTLKPVIELVSAAYNNLNYNTEFYYLPISRGLVEAQKNTWVDAELGRVESAQYILTDFIKVPVKIFTTDVVAYYLSPSMTVNGWESLSKYRIASLNGFVAIQDKIERYNLKDINLVVSAQQCFKLLAAGRVDIILLPKNMGKMLATVDNELQVKEVKLDTISLYHFIHKRHQHLVPLLTKELTNLLDKK